MRGLLYLLCDLLIVKQIVLHVKMFRKSSSTSIFLPSGNLRDQLRRRHRYRNFGLLHIYERLDVAGFYFVKNCRISCRVICDFLC